MVYAFVTEFPYFEKDDEGGVTFVHHPFTMPWDDDIPLIEPRPAGRAGQGVRSGR